jgi:hypothetical protein
MVSNFTFPPRGEVKLGGVREAVHRVCTDVCALGQRRSVEFACGKDGSGDEDDGEDNVEHVKGSEERVDRRSTRAIQSEQAEVTTSSARAR